MTRLRILRVIILAAALLSMGTSGTVVNLGFEDGMAHWCPTHHFALGVGYHAAELKKLGRALGIETVVVTEKLITH